MNTRFVILKVYKGIFLFIHVFISAIVFGQTTNLTLPSQLNIPSPNTSSLGIYGEIPVTLFTGIPEINVPVCESKCDKINTSINLSYHSSGIKINQQPSWVGLGWNLNAGGCITRVVKGAPDETKYKTFMSNNYSKFQEEERGFYYKHSYTDNPQFFTNREYLFDIEGITSGAKTWKTLWYDYAPDEFSFNFLGFSGKFFLSQTGEWKVQSDKHFKVDFNNSFVDNFMRKNFNTGDIRPIIGDMTHTFAFFTITDEFGNKYVFGNDKNNGKDDAIEYSFPMAYLKSSLNFGDQFVANAWYLTKVIMANTNEEIIYHYDRGPFIANFNNYSYATKNYSSSTGLFSGYNCGSKTSPELLIDGSYNSPVYLHEIDFPSHDFKVKFKISKSQDLMYSWKNYSLVNSFNLAGGVGDAYRIWIAMMTCYNVSNLIPFFDTNKPDIYDDEAVVNQQIGNEFNNLVFRLKLDEVDVLNLSESKCIRKIHFNYIENSTARLKLANLVIADASDIQVEKYEFEYNQTILPEYLEGIEDAWGYYNGNIFPQDQVSNFFNHFVEKQNYFRSISNDFFEDQSQFHSPNFQFASAEILTSIKYPTGGTTAFEYELNDYSSYCYFDHVNNLYSLFDENGIGGGLRIKKITNYSSFGNKNVKEYFYKNNFHTNPLNSEKLVSSGILCRKPKFKYTSTFKDNGSGGNITKLEICSFFPCNPITSCSISQVFGYSEVAERTTNDLSSGFSVSKFTNYSKVLSGNVYDKNSFNEIPLVGYGNIEFNKTNLGSENNFRGKLLEKTDYDNFGPVLKKEIKYANIGNTSNDYCRSFLFTVFHPCGSTSIINSPNGSFAIVSDVFIPVWYLNPLYSKLKIEENVYKYDISDKTRSSFVKQSVNYAYNSTYKLLTSVTTTGSSGLKSISLFTFPIDYNIQPYLKMTANGIVNIAISQIDILNGKSIYKKTTNYYNFNDGSGTINHDLFAPKTVEELKGNNNLEVKVRYHGYDNFGNVICMSKENDVKQSYLWDYNNSKPVASVTNSNQNDIAYTSFEADGKGNWIYADRNSQVGGITGLYEYNLSNGNITSLTLDISKYYFLSYWSKSPNASMVKINASGTSLSGVKLTQMQTGSDTWYLYMYKITSASSVIISGNEIIDELRLYPSDAQMTTYTYDPLIGMTSKCDANNRITYYEYDNFQRLKVIRDQNKNIVKLFEYTYGAEALQFGNDEKKVQLKPSNCTGTQIGSVVTYVVKENKYLAATKAAANAAAQTEINNSAQAYANANGVCNDAQIIYLVNGSNMGGLAVSIDGVSYNFPSLQYYNTPVLVLSGKKHKIEFPDKVAKSVSFSEVARGSAFPFTSVSNTAYFNLFVKTSYELDFPNDKTKDYVLKVNDYASFTPPTSSYPFTVNLLGDGQTPNNEAMCSHGGRYVTQVFASASSLSAGTSLFYDPAHKHPLFGIKYLFEYGGGKKWEIDPTTGIIVKEATNIVCPIIKLVTCNLSSSANPKAPPYSICWFGSATTSTVYINDDEIEKGTRLYSDPACTQLIDNSIIWYRVGYDIYSVQNGIVGDISTIYDCH